MAVDHAPPCWAPLWETYFHKDLWYQYVSIFSIPEDKWDLMCDSETPPLLGKHHLLNKHPDQPPFQTS